MSSRIVKEVANRAKKVSIILAGEVQDRGYKRVIDAIDPVVIGQTAENVANAFSASKMITASQKARASKIIITYGTARRRLKMEILMKNRSIPHPSADDPDEHSTIYIKDSAGKNVCVGHVATDPSKQKVRPY